MNEDEIKELAEKVLLEVGNADLVYFKKSFSAVLPMITKLLDEKIPNETDIMERIISTPLRITELTKIRHQLNVSILSKEQIRKNSSLKSSKIVINRKHR